MKINLLLNIGASEGNLPSLKEGPQDVADHIGEELMKRGWATDITPPKTIEAVPPPPAIQSIEKPADEPKPSGSQKKPTK